LAADDFNRRRISRPAIGSPPAVRNVVAGSIEDREIAVGVIEMIGEEQRGLSRRVRRERENRAEEKRKSIQ
jgi:hypothetical protein